MALFKCKMCGGTLEINHNETVATCEYCGTPQTLPKLNDEMRANLYDRANHFRRNNEFDKAMGIYEKILNEDHTDAEAYWSLVLCRYGIEYVEDPTSHKRIPTVNRAQFTSIFDDDNYKSALQYADGDQHELYEEEAKAINEIQKGILAISQKEEPFDVFICYKETDDTGRRTPDSVLANDLYHQLTQEGFKVFFARITLEDKLGSAYEPYIFAALNSAKVMVVLGTRPEFFRAVWVRNEWSRYLALIKQGQKKMLIPAYKDMDPYDLPEEFSHLQAQDMAKLGFMQDLVRGIKKIAQVDEPAPVAASAAPTATGNGNIAPLLKRAFMFLEDGDWHSANEYCEKVLDMDPENAQAYLGKLMAAFQRHKTEELKDLEQPFDQHNLYQKAYRFGDEALKTALAGYNAHINARNEAARLEAAYVQAKKDLYNANSENDVQKAAQAFRRLGDYKDAPEMIRRCGEKTEELRKEQIYARALSRMRDGEIADYKAAIEQLKTIPGWKDSDDLIEKYQKRIREMEMDEKRKKRIIRIALLCMAVFVVAIVVWSTVLEPMNRYNNAVGMMEAGNSDEAYKIFCELGNFKDSADKAAEIRYNTAVEMMEEGKYSEAIEVFTGLGDYGDSTTMITYNRALELMEQGEYENAIAVFEELNGYKDSAEQIKECTYANAISLMNRGEYTEARAVFLSLGTYKDAAQKANEAVKAALRNCKVGQNVIFGTYEGKPIEWQVLAVQNGRALVISTKAVADKPFNETWVKDVKWETCSLRKWLNNDFLNTAFTSAEKARIPTVTVSADKNPEYPSNTARATCDQIFLLSIAEAEKYFKSDAEREAIDGGSWLLRTNGGGGRVSWVDLDGKVDTFGVPVVNPWSVCPAMWIEMNG